MYVFNFRCYTDGAYDFKPKGFVLNKFDKLYYNYYLTKVYDNLEEAVQEVKSITKELLDTITVNDMYIKDMLMDFYGEIDTLSMLNKEEIKDNLYTCYYAMHEDYEGTFIELLEVK